MAKVADLDQIRSKRKAVAAFFPYAVWQERNGECRTVDAFLLVARASRSGEFMWEAIGPFVTTPFEEESPDSLNRVITLVSPYVRWDTWSFNKTAVTRWEKAASAVPYTEAVGRFVVEALLEIASVNSLRPHIPFGIWARLNDVWAWLKEQPPLPPVWFGRFRGKTRGVVHGVRELGDIQILKSYLLLVWSEWDCVDLRGFTEMCTSLREDFSGIGMGHHRHDLVVRLDHILRQLHWEGYIRKHNPRCEEDSFRTSKSQYGKLKELLLEMDKEALSVLTRMHSGLINQFDLLTPVGVHRIPLDIRLCAPSPVSIIAYPQPSLLAPKHHTSFVRGFRPSFTPSSKGSPGLLTRLSLSPDHRHICEKRPTFTSSIGSGPARVHRLTSDGFVFIARFVIQLLSILRVCSYICSIYLYVRLRTAAMYRSIGGGESRWLCTTSHNG